MDQEVEIPTYMLVMEVDDRQYQVCCNHKLWEWKIFFGTFALLFIVIFAVTTYFWCEAKEDQQDAESDFFLYIMYICGILAFFLSVAFFTIYFYIHGICITWKRWIRNCLNSTKYASKPSLRSSHRRSSALNRNLSSESFHLPSYGQSDFDIFSPPPSPSQHLEMVEKQTDELSIQPPKSQQLQVEVHEPMLCTYELVSDETESTSVPSSKTSTSPEQLLLPDDPGISDYWKQGAIRKSARLNRVPTLETEKQEHEEFRMTRSKSQELRSSGSHLTRELILSPDQLGDPQKIGSGDLRKRRQVVEQSQRRTSSQKQLTKLPKEYTY